MLALTVPPDILPSFESTPTPISMTGTKNWYASSLSTPRGACLSVQPNTTSHSPRDASASWDTMSMATASTSASGAIRLIFSATTSAFGPSRVPASVPYMRVRLLAENTSRSTRVKRLTPARASCSATDDPVPPTPAMPAWTPDSALCPAIPNARICRSYRDASTGPPPAALRASGRTAIRRPTTLSWSRGSTLPSSVHTLPVIDSGPKRRLPMGLPRRHFLTVSADSDSPWSSDGEYSGGACPSGCVCAWITVMPSASAIPIALLKYRGDISRRRAVRTL